MIKKNIIIVFLILSLSLILINPLDLGGCVSDKDGNCITPVLISDKEYNSYKYQKIETEFINFELPVMVTHYLSPNDITYEEEGKGGFNKKF